MRSRSSIKQYTPPSPIINQSRCKNGASFFQIHRGTVPALKLELMFPAGRPYEAKKGLATATLQLIKGGTTKKSATKVADGFDHWGSSVNFDYYVDQCGIKVYVLEKYLAKVLPLLIEMLSEAVFPASERKLYKRQQKEKLRSDDLRGDVVAYRTFTEHLFGTKHPYGYNSTVESIEEINREDLINHFQSHYCMDRCKIFLSGSFEESTANLIQDTLGNLRLKNHRPPRRHLPHKFPPPGNFQILLQDSVQTSIRLGRRLFNRQHPDYVSMYVFNTLLGGYYGSNLMQNLREKNGLTYHIYSSLDTFMLDGYFLISTEVDKLRSPLAIREIYAEINRLKAKPVKASELQTVKNYLLGSFLQYFENAFAESELIRVLSLEGGKAAFVQLIEGIKNVTAEDIQRIAKKYFQEKDLTLITVG